MGKNVQRFVVLAVLASFIATTPAIGQGLGFTYQAQLQNNGSLASGDYNLTFSLFNASVGGALIAGPVTNDAVAVTNGLFTTMIDFGAGVFTGATNWLQIGVATNGVKSFIPLTPRQQLTPVPYAIFASTAGNLSGAISGNGSGLTNLNASYLVSGVIPISLLPGFQYSGNYAAVGGGLGNNASGQYSSVGGGGNNTNSAAYATVGGGYENITSNDEATVGGGGYNVAGGQYSTVSGGDGNTAGDFAAVGGGDNNKATNEYATVGGGVNNTASGYEAVVGGGNGNIASGTTAFVGAGGYAGFTIGGNTASGGASVVGGGISNQATNFCASVPGGFYNLAAGEYSFAAGQQAQAMDQGDFVWADSQNSVFSSTANDQFLIRAQGGVGINANINPGKTEMASLFVQGINSGGWPNSVVCFQNTQSSINNAPALRVVNSSLSATNVDGALSVSIGGAGFIAEFGNASTYVVTITNNGTIYATAFSSASDRHAKEHFTPINPQEVLAKVTAMPITEWNFKADESTRHVGPMAQDFYEAFNVGTDDKHIATVDEDGVALAAIQGLNQKLNEKAEEIQGLKRQNNLLAERLNELEAAVKSIEARK